MDKMDVQTIIRFKKLEPNLNSHNNHNTTTVTPVTSPVEGLTSSNETQGNKQDSFRGDVGSEYELVWHVKRGVLDSCLESLA